MADASGRPRIAGPDDRGTGVTTAAPAPEIPEFGQIDPLILDQVLRQNLLLASHNAALTSAIQALQARLEAIDARDIAPGDVSAPETNGHGAIEVLTETRAP